MHVRAAADGPEYWLTAAVTAPAWRLSRGPSDGQLVAVAAVPTSSTSRADRSVSVRMP